MKWILLIQLMVSNGGGATAVGLASLDACERAARAMHRANPHNWRDAVAFCINSETGDTVHIQRKRS